MCSEVLRAWYLIVKGVVKFIKTQYLNFWDGTIGDNSLFVRPISFRITSTQTYRNYCEFSQKFHRAVAACLSLYGAGMCRKGTRGRHAPNVYETSRKLLSRHISDKESALEWLWIKHQI